MTASTLTVTDFVLARLAEDEASVDDIVEVARAHPWTHEDCAMVHVPAARVLAQCAAMRRIVQLAGMSQGGYKMLMAEALCALASIWSDHPAWREEWR